MYWTGSKISKHCKENWDVCKAVFSNRPFQGFDRRNDEKAAAYPVCRLPVYYIEGQRISQYRLDGSIERDAGHIVQYLRIRGCSGSRIVHTLIFLLGKTTGTRTTVSDSSHNVYYVKLLPKPSTKRLCRICRQANKSCFWKWRQKMPSEP